jgi:capsid portal protein
MQSYDKNNKSLPSALTPEEIVDNIASFEQSAAITDLLNKALPNFFASDEFNECDTDHRKEMAYSYRVLMETMARIQEYERRTFNIGIDFWQPCMS